MRIVLISPNQTALPCRVTPVGLLYLASNLRAHGHEVRIVDLMFSREPLETIRRDIRAFRPHLVGMGMRNIDLIIATGQDYVSFYASCVAAVRQATNAPLVVGGGGFTMFAPQLLEMLRPDFGILGEADGSLPLLAQALATGADTKKIPGIAYLGPEGPVVSSPARVEDLDAIPNQAIDLIDAGKYRRRRGVFGVFTARSCPQGCSFCNDHFLNGPLLRRRSAKRVVQEIVHLHQKTHMAHFAFADPLFNAHRGHMVAVLRELIEQRAPVQFQMEMNPVGQDEQSVALLKKAGCIAVDLTADAGCDTMLKNLNKAYDCDKIMNVAQLYARHRIPYSVGFLMGGPGENEETVEKTIRFAERLPSPGLVYFSVGVTVLPHTALASRLDDPEQPLDAQGVHRPRDHRLNIRHYLSSQFDDRCAQALLRACARNSVFFISDFFFLPIMGLSTRMMDWMNVQPSWKNVSFLKRSLALLPRSWTSLAWNPTLRRFALAAKCT